MEGEERRKKLIEILRAAKEPVSGSALAKLSGVSRQVIVQDIALLRAVNKDIVATTKGYILYELQDERFTREFRVQHKDNEIKDELYTIIDNGGKVLDIIVFHEVYGQIRTDLVLENRKDVDDFCARMEKGSSKPLKTVAGDMHIHTVEASSEVILDNIKRALIEKGYLIF